MDHGGVQIPDWAGILMSDHKRVLSGMRSTGALHLGHLHGALQNWVRLQYEHECYFFVADWHALTTEYKEARTIQEKVAPMVADFLAAGVDPGRAVLFIQSSVKEHAELYLLLSMFTPLGWLERVPTFKEQVQALADKEIHTHGFLGYPVLQTADIILYNAHYVPVGMDQVSHLELCREIVRRVNFLTGQEVFVEPAALLTASAKITGPDGRKMSKSYGNAIFFGDDEEKVRQTVMSYITDTQRARKSDPGRPDVCNFYPLHEIYTPAAEREEIKSGCTSASMGCVECKKRLLPHLNTAMAPIREKRDELLRDPSAIMDVLVEGNHRARAKARETMARLREALGMNYSPDSSGA
ncbi:MAG: Tryptophan--tRNA ligase [Myxococcota bacterium]|nr:Tryptophan--tRNA ligase [Myxococcota bacterium]